MPPTLSVREVLVRYGSVTALDRVSVTVASGSVLALVGESGSGKSTVLRCLNRTVLPAQGSITLDDTDIATLEPIVLRRRMGYVPQHGGLVPHWTIERNVALVPTLLGLDDPAGRAREALQRCTLDPDTFARRLPHQLSGGQRQRAAIARAIAASQDVLLLDEAFGALDAISRDDLLERFGALLSELRPTTVFVTHDLGEAARLADTVAVVRAGRIEQCAPLAELRRAPATQYVADLLARAEAVAHRVLGP